jgi:hypothetical protein
MSGLSGYSPSEEHELLRQTVRELADAKIAPSAADVDAGSRFPQEALDALTGASLQAAHSPESYGGEGADALATVIIIEEVARACASSSLIPAVNKLGTVPLLLSASEELKRRYVGGVPVDHGPVVPPHQAHQVALRPAARQTASHLQPCAGTCGGGPPADRSPPPRPAGRASGRRPSPSSARGCGCPATVRAASPSCVTGGSGGSPSAPAPTSS